MDDTLTEAAQLSDQVAENFRPYYMWLRTEQARAAGNLSKARDLYDEAIEAAKASGFVHFAACMNERCAAIIDKPKLRAGYLLEAERLWRQWGFVSRSEAIILRNPHVFPAQAHVQSSTPFKDPNGHQYSPEVVTLQPEERLSRRPSLSLTDLENSHVVNELNRARPLQSRPSFTHGSSLPSDSMGETPTVNTLPDVRSLLNVELDMRTVLRASMVIADELNVDRYATSATSNI